MLHNSRWWHVVLVKVGKVLPVGEKWSGIWMHYTASPQKRVYYSRLLTGLALWAVSGGQMSPPSSYLRSWMYVIFIGNSCFKNVKLYVQQLTKLYPIHQSLHRILLFGRSRREEVYKKETWELRQQNVYCQEQNTYVHKILSTQTREILRRFSYPICQFW